jgi:hypothetical protein
MALMNAQWQQQEMKLNQWYFETNGLNLAQD